MARNGQDQVTAAARLQRILELRTLGQTLEQIGADPMVQRSKSNVKHALDKALDTMAVEHADQARRLKALAYNRLEKLLSKAMILGAGGNLKAMGAAMKLIMAQARVMGYDAPVKVAHTDPTGDHESIAPGTYVLPSRPHVTIEDWQAQADAIWQQQRERDQVRAEEDSEAPES